jgi:hypothetical protein
MKNIDEWRCPEKIKSIAQCTHFNTLKVVRVEITVRLSDRR